MPKAPTPPDTGNKRLDEFLTFLWRRLPPLTAKGDLFTYDGNKAVALNAGANGEVLVADFSQASGLKWAPSLSSPNERRSEGSMENVGFSISGDVITINQANGSAFANSYGNRGYLWLRSPTNGRLVRGEITSNTSITLGSAHFGTDGKGDLTDAIIRIYGINNSFVTDGFVPNFGVGYCGGFNKIRTSGQMFTSASSVTAPEHILVKSNVGTDNSPITDIGYCLANRTDSTNTWAFTKAFPGESADGIWQPWVTTWGGFSAIPTASMKWCQVGMIAFIKCDVSANGTSNATTLTLTAPLKSNIQKSDVSGILTNNSVVSPTPGRTDFAAGSATMTCFRDMTALAWTNALSKGIDNHLAYEVFQP